jgi:toxin-antitoxin system PIN domain toxin
VIVPDINLLVFAYNSDAPHHEPARHWWESCLSEGKTVGIPWAVSLGFVRLMTTRAVLTDPMRPEEALRHVRSWLVRPQVRELNPGPRHLEILSEIMQSAGASGRLTTDAHLAAIAIEVQAELHSNDADFSRFPGLKWTDPLGDNRK